MRSLFVASLCFGIVVGAGSAADAQTLAGGRYHSVVRTPDGRAWTWGSNTNGALGESGGERRVPGVIDSLSDVAGVAAGHMHSLALMNDGSVRAWGSNGRGQLGDGSTTQRNSPVFVSGLTDVVAVAGGYTHSVALTADGQVWTWGANSYGELGDGTQVDRLSPAPVTGMTSVVAVAAGTHFVVAVKSDGTAWAWGRTAVTPSSGRYGSPQTVSLSSATPDVTIRYTLDGAEPSSTSSIFTAPFQVSSTRTIKARAYRSGWTESDTGAGSLWIAEGTLQTPVIAPGSGAYTTPTLITENRTNRRPAIPRLC